ncbi:cold-shock protein [Rhizohabitans arisaemae]|uniref:cold-shock protein n=1 Tax=Rhizohabitans arisaemae TaxID=2720610 RepID=UPI0024B18AAC|nr:cold shock domain-containing protein [Rhizohabitans arisaemae]
MAAGTVVRYDRAQGYGFITPDGGGEDVFLHASVLDDDLKAVLRGGMRVEYQTMQGERGLKAFQVHILDSPGVPSFSAGYLQAKAAAPRSADGGDEELCDVIAASELAQVITDVLITVAPNVTGSQIIQVRERLIAFAHQHGWVE